MKKIIKSLYIILPIILVIFITISVWFNILTGFENWFYQEATERMSNNLTTIMKIITYLGDTIAVIGIGIILFIIPLLRKKYAIPIATTVIISTISNIVLKAIFSRDRPDILRLVSETGYSFPSGHAMINMSLYSMAILLVAKNVKNKACRMLLIICFSMLAILIGFSRVYLGVHYITDIIAGWCFGFLITILIYHLHKKYIANI